MAKKKAVTTDSVNAAPAKKTVKKVPKPEPVVSSVVDHGAGREVVYDTLGSTVYAIGGENGPLSEDDVKQLLGWQEEPEGGEWGLEFDLKDMTGKKIRLNNNIANRPFRASLSLTWEGEFLHGSWQVNGEAILLGRTGLVLDGQHRLVAFVLACQEYAMRPQEWPNMVVAEVMQPDKTVIKTPVMETFVAFGISESSKVVDTINTGAPRTLADVIYRAFEHLFGEELPKKDMVAIGKISEHAIRLLSHRTAAFKDAFSPTQPHSELIDFVYRHSRLLKCVRHVYESEDKETKSISGIVPLSTAAALMFLMGSCESDGKRYNDIAQPNENMLKWGRYKDAQDFWAYIGDNNSRVFAIKQAISVASQDVDSVSKAERIGIVIKAWHFFSCDATRDTSMDADHLKLEYSGTGMDRRLVEFPQISPIDRVPGKRIEPENEAPVEPESSATGLKIGDSVWIQEADIEASWQAQIVEVNSKGTKDKHKVKILKPFAGAGKEVYVFSQQIRLTKPRPTPVEA